MSCQERTHRGNAARLNIDGAMLTNILASFTKWLYFGSIITKTNFQRDLWCFGQRIRSPRFQNAALRPLRTNCYAAMAEEALADLFRHQVMKRVWDVAYSEPVALREQKMLMILLDHMVYLGVDHPDVKRVTYNGGDLTLQLANRMSVAPRAGDLHLLPWRPDHFDKYHFNENSDLPNELSNP